MAEYYRYKDVAVRFDVFKDGELTTPDQAAVLIYDPDRLFLGRFPADIADGEVRYVLNGEDVEQTGTYKFVFEVKVSGLGDYTHVVNAEVEESPVPTEVKTYVY